MKFPPNLLLRLAIAAGVILTEPTALAADWRIAPPNPQFATSLAQRASLGAGPSLTEDGYALGYRQGPLQLPPAKASLPGPTSEPPSRFDLRQVGGLPPIRNQGLCGSCWAFASFGSLESYLKYRHGRVWNFSEQDLNQNHGFDSPECEGGNQWMSTAYLARWSGPLTERQAPYPYLESAHLQSAPAAGFPARRHIQQVSVLPVRLAPTDNQAVKTAVMGKGGVFMAFEYSADGYRADTHSYYTETNSANHAVVIVGWNDDFPRGNFRTDLPPPGDGAFIVRNSWGTNWGEQGYFYLSYYDRSITDLVVFDNAEKVSNYRMIYEYDPLGWTQSIGPARPRRSTAWFANIFQVASAGPVIQGVSFYTPVPGSRYVVFLYDQVTPENPTSGQVVHRQAGTIETAGYHTIRLDREIAVTTGSKFAAVVKLKTPGYAFPVPLEGRVANSSSAASANTGQSFVSTDGVSWKDLASFEDSPPFNLKYANVALKVFGGQPLE